MPSAEIITIGTEILLGEILDTNTRTIACTLRDLGVDLYRKTTVGDNVSRIAQAIEQALERTDIIITTGGLGPTIDDPTREAVALALGVETVYHQELWEQIQARFRRFGRVPTENNRRQAYIPQNAIAVENPVGTAPAFIVETGRGMIFALPGVPREMEHLLEKAVAPYIRQRFGNLGVIKARLLHTSGVGESQIDELIDDLERLSNPTVGLAAHAGQVDIRITAKAGAPEEAERMIIGIEKTIRERLGDWIYGVDDETLEDIALANLAAHGWSLGVLEAGLNGSLTQRLASSAGPFRGGEALMSLPEADTLQRLTHEYLLKRKTNVALGAALFPAGEKQDLHLVLITPAGEKTIIRSYGGPPQMAGLWAINVCLDLLRKITPLSAESKS
jgi:nicotinamide-nucleotide amidase